MIGIFGGSFDPPHFGHIKSALALLELFPFEQIRFVPCQLSPHKQVTHASAEHRIQMLNLVSKGVVGLEVDALELNRSPPSYTIDTLISLREELGKQVSLVLILGADVYLKFCQWHQYEKILSYCHLMILHRPGFDLDEIRKNADHKCEQEYIEQYLTEDLTNLQNLPAGKIFINELEQIDISSSEIREMIAAGEQPRYVIPGVIWNYINRNKLYKTIT